MEIYISPKKICTEFECGTKIFDFPLRVNRGSAFEYLSEEKIPKNIEEVIFFRKKWLGWSQMVLPEEYQSAALLFLQMFHNDPTPSFDCYSFAILAGGLPLHNKEWLHAFWDFKRIDPERLRGPKIVFLVNEAMQGFGHAALHIGRGYMLSVQGAGGQLSVSTLTDLQIAYRDFPTLWEVTPKSAKEVQRAVQMIARQQTEDGSD